MDDAEMTNEVRASDVKKPAIPWGWLRAVLQFIAWLIVNLVLQSIAIVVVAILQGMDLTELMTDGSQMMKNIGTSGMIVVYLFSLGGTLLTVWLFRRFIDHKSFISLGFRFKAYRNDLFAGMGWGIILIAIGFITLWVSGMVTVTRVQFDPLTVILYIIFFSIVALNEEILVRGYILLNLMDSMNKYMALVLSSILFSAMHLFNANMAIVPAINIFLAGILLGIYFIHKGNLWFPIGMHFTWNFFQGPVFGFEVSGLQTENIIIQDITGHELLTGGEFGFEGSLIATVAILFLIAVIHLKHREASVA